MADSLLGNVVGYMKRAVNKGLDSGIGGMTKESSKKYFADTHDEGFYGHIKGNSIKSSKKMKGAC